MTWPTWAGTDLSAFVTLKEIRAAGSTEKQLTLRASAQNDVARGPYSTLLSRRCFDRIVSVGSIDEKRD